MRETLRAIGTTAQINIQRSCGRRKINRVDAIATVKAVVTGSSHHGVVTATGIQGVVAFTTGHQIASTGTRQQIVTRRATNQPDQLNIWVDQNFVRRTATRGGQGVFNTTIDIGRLVLLPWSRKNQGVQLIAFDDDGSLYTNGLVITIHPLKGFSGQRQGVGSTTQ